LNRIKDLFRIDEVDPESRNRVMLIGGISALVLLALGLIAAGYYIDRIKPRGETVFTVGDRKFSYAYLEDRVDAAYADGTFNTSNVQLGIATIVSDIQNEELVRLIAKEDGVTLSPEELDAAIRADAGVPDTSSNDVMARILRSHLQTLGLSLGRYEEMITARALQQKLTDNIKAGLPAEMEEVNLSVILVTTDADAATALQRIRNGEDFGAVAKDVSKHSSAADGGALGWVPADLLVPELADAAFALEPGSVSDVIESTHGFYVAKSDGKEVRELDDTTKTSLARADFGKRLEDESNKYELQNLLTTQQAQQLANHLQSASG
jgi:parvulin-like peptidyl-prolyl isomerase